MSSELSDAIKDFSEPVKWLDSKFRPSENSLDGLCVGLTQTILTNLKEQQNEQSRTSERRVLHGSVG